MPPTWLTVIAWISLAAAFGSAAAILYDIYVRGWRQPMGIMEAVWPITALFLGPLGWLAYARIGRPRLVSPPNRAAAEDPERHGVFTSAIHCGAGCALGDLVEEWVVFAAAVTIAGVALWPEYLIDFTLAYAFGILFQYYAIKPMSDLTPRQAITDAMISETLSIVAFEAGMFAVMALVYFVLFTDPHLDTNHAAYWLTMQIAATIGLVTSFPVNLWLVRRGIKHPMARATIPASATAQPHPPDQRG